MEDEVGSFPRFGDRVDLSCSLTNRGEGGEGFVVG